MSQDTTSPSSISELGGLGGPVERFSKLGSVSSVGDSSSASCWVSGGFPEESLLVFSPSGTKGFVVFPRGPGFAPVDGGAVSRFGFGEAAGFVNFTFFFSA